MVLIIYNKCVFAACAFSPVLNVLNTINSNIINKFTLIYNKVQSYYDDTWRGYISQTSLGLFELRDIIRLLITLSLNLIIS